MKKPTSLQLTTDYHIALLWLMGELGSGRAADVCAEFERRLGDLISPEHYLDHNDRVKKWENTVHWSRLALVGVRLMGSGGRGVWTITEAGRAWLQNHPDGAKDELLPLISRAQRQRSPGTANTPRPAELQKRNSATESRQYSPQSRSNVATYAVLDRIVNQIDLFLQGRIARPSDDVLCDWVQLCYTFELYTEGQKLFEYIDRSAVDPWPYQRAKRLAQVCRMHVDNQ